MSRTWRADWGYPEMGEHHILQAGDAVGARARFEGWLQELPIDTLKEMGTVHVRPTDEDFEIDLKPIIQKAADAWRARQAATDEAEERALYERLKAKYETKEKKE